MVFQSKQTFLEVWSTRSQTYLDSNTWLETHVSHATLEGYLVLLTATG